MFNLIKKGIALITIITTLGFFSFVYAYTPKTITAVNDAQIDTAQKKFGTASGLFDGTTDYLTTPDNADWFIGTGDFTIDLWFRPTSTTAYDTWCGQFIDNSNLWKFDMGASATHPRFTWSDAGTIQEAYATDAQTFTNGTWYHLEVDRSGGTMYIFLDGVSLALTITGTLSKSIPDFASLLYIGYDKLNAGRDIDGHLDEFRFLKGVARHTANFTPATSEYSTDADTKLLLHCNGTDGSTNFVDGDEFTFIPQPSIY